MYSRHRFEELTSRNPISTHAPGRVLSGFNVKRKLVSGHTIPEYEDFSVWETRRKRYLHFVRIVNAVVNASLFVPRKIYAYVRHKLEELQDGYLHNMADLTYMYMEPTLILKGADSIDFKNITANSETVDSGNQRQEQNGKVPVLLRLLRQLFCRIRSALSFLCSHVTALFHVRDKKQNGKVPAGVGLRRLIRELVCRSTRAMSFLWFHLTAHFRDRDKKQNGKVPAGVGLTRLFHELFRRSTSVMSFLYSHLASSLFRDRGKKHVQQTTSQEIGRSSSNVSREQNEGKASRSSPPYQVTSERVQSCKSSLCRDTANLPASPNTGRKNEPQRLSSSRHSLVEKERLKASSTAGQRAEKHDVTFSSKVKVNGKIIPSSTLHSKVDSAARASVDESNAEKNKAKKEEKPPVHVDIPAPTLPVKGKVKRKAMPPLIPAQTHGHVTAPVDPQVRANTSSGVADSSQVWCANVGSDTHGTSSAKEQVDTELTSPRIKRAKNEEDCEQLRSWDVPTSIDRTQKPLPGSKSMKRKAESGGVDISKPKPTECVASKRHRVDMQTSQAVTAEQLELMEVGESPPEIPFPESMEIGGEENAVIFLERDEPAEEMETDELALPTTPSIEVMERNQHPFTMAMPFGQLPDAWWPVATAMGRSEATATESQQESMETNQELIDAREPVASPFVELADAMRLNAAGQAIMQPAVNYPCQL
ncbi:hypothetical protein OS493_007621 [Desmophyllum pertusum]|uniref:Uncharacterized protein n=1 Tax=Desmophyllum pertusum TaxID=174260 RepID=A0A9W9YRK1_9CNID|nr:hypothetical protein OS493_007621 [Desmophyllum pertusum]